MQKSNTDCVNVSIADFMGVTMALQHIKYNLLRICLEFVTHDPDKSVDTNDKFHTNAIST